MTNKIDLIVRHEVLVSYFSNGFKEIKVVNVFNNWEDIHDVIRVRDSIIKRHGPMKMKELYFSKNKIVFIQITILMRYT